MAIQARDLPGLYGNLLEVQQILMHLCHRGKGMLLFQGNLMAERKEGTWLGGREVSTRCLYAEKTVTIYIAT